MIKLPPDITFVIQLVAFVAFWQLMRVLLFVPVQRALATRDERMSGARTRAEALRAEAASLTSEIGAKLAMARADGLQQADTIRRRAEQEEQAILGGYRDQVNALLERERGVTAQQVETARAPLESEASRLAERVVAKLLGRAA